MIKRDGLVATALATMAALGGCVQPQRPPWLDQYDRGLAHSLWQEWATLETERAPSRIAAQIAPVQARLETAEARLEKVEPMAAKVDPMLPQLLTGMQESLDTAERALGRFAADSSETVEDGIEAGRKSVIAKLDAKIEDVSAGTDEKIDTAVARLEEFVQGQQATNQTLMTRLDTVTARAKRAEEAYEALAKELREAQVMGQTDIKNVASELAELRKEVGDLKTPNGSTATQPTPPDSPNKRGKISGAASGAIVGIRGYIATFIGLVGSNVSPRLSGWTPKALRTLSGEALKLILYGLKSILDRLKKGETGVVKDLTKSDRRSKVESWLRRPIRDAFLGGFIGFSVGVMLDSWL